MKKEKHVKELKELELANQIKFIFPNNHILIEKVMNLAFLLEDNPGIFKIFNKIQFYLKKFALSFSEKIKSSILTLKFSKIKIYLEFLN